MPTKTDHAELAATKMEESREYWRKDAAMLRGALEAVLDERVCRKRIDQALQFLDLYDTGNTRRLNQYEISMELRAILHGARDNR